MNYSLSQIAKITGGKLYGNDLTITSVATDSRNHIPSAALFCAIDGLNHNGNKFIDEVAERGINAFLCNTKPTNDSASYVLVENTLDSLQKLAEFHRSNFNGEVVAITGSGGKTIVKEWFAQMWDSKNGKLLRSPMSYNSQLGVALSLLMIEGNEKLVFIEAGISMAGEMKLLEQMIKPTVGVFTTIGEAHSENFSSIEQKQSEKEILFKNTRHVIRQTKKDSIIESNLQTAIDIYNYLDISHKQPTNIGDIAMRLEVREGIAGSLLINDSYSCDITSLTIALDFADRYTLKRKVVILSDMVNPNTDYSVVSELIKAHKIDLLIAVGTNIFDKMNNNLTCDVKYFNSKENLLHNIHEEWFTEAVVLIKGASKYGFNEIATRLEKFTHTTILEVNLATMVENLNYYRGQLSAQTKIMTMVKADSYGAGTTEIASMLQHHGVDYLAVAFADEGVGLRKAGVHMPIVVLNSDPESYQTMIQHRLEPEIYSLKSLHKFIAHGNSCGSYNLPIHIKLDTGMHRLGFLQEDIDELIETLNMNDTVSVSTIFSHLAAADDPQHDEFTNSQITTFKKICNHLRNNIKQVQEPLCHICNSAGIERFPDAHMDMVRLGIGLYQHTPVSRLLTRIVQIKNLLPPETVGYMRNGKLTKPSRIAIIPIGYADGLNRALGNGAIQFSVQNTLCPTIGNICMDTCMVDITNAPSNINEGDLVEIFGLNTTANDLAKALNTIDYEILTSVSKRIKRVYIN